MDTRAEVSLLNSFSEEETRLALAIAAAELGIWDWDIPTNGMRYSPRAREICGFSQHEPVTYEMVRDITHPDDLPRTSRMAREALDPTKRTKPVFEYRIIRTDGTIRWVLAHGEAVFDGPGHSARALRYVGTIQDITESKQAQDALKSSESSLRLALRASHLAIWHFDVATSSIRGSPELYRLLGYPDGAQPTLEELRANYYGDDRELVTKAAQAALAEGQRYFEARYRYQVPGTPMRWLHLRAEIQFDHLGAPSGAIGVVGDITKNRTAELEQRDLLARLVAALDASATGTWKWNVLEDVVEWDQSLCKVYEIPYDGRPRNASAFLELVHPEDRQKTQDRIAASLTSKGSIEHEFRILRPDGEVRWIYDRSRPLLGEQGDVIAIVGACSDITARKASEQQLLDNQQRLQRAHEVAGIGDFEIDLASRDIKWSDSLYQLIGQRRVAFQLSQDKLDLIHPDDRDTLVTNIERGIEGQALNFEFRVKHSDGSYRWLACRGERQLDENGKPVRLVGLNFDITELRETQFKQQRLINELNHRVKNTLTTVQSLAQMSFKSYDINPPALKSFTDRLFALSATHSLLTDSLWESVDLESLIVAELKPYLGPRIELRRGPATTLAPNVAVSLGMVIHELATNAVKYGALSASDGKLLIRWSTIDNGRTSLEWIESGTQRRSSKSRSGFGSKLIEALVENDLKGSLMRRQGAGGLEVGIEF